MAVFIEPKDFLKSRLKEYYDNNFIDFDSISLREFAYGMEKKIEHRHLSFSDAYSLNNFLRGKLPFYVSVSASYYEKADARPMSAKKIIKSDLVFEFDADDIDTDCKKYHDIWYCKNCGAKGSSNIKECPNCKSRVSVKDWLCDICIDAAKKQSLKLIDILLNDFAFSLDELYINYSGHKGYHIWVRSEKISKLKAEARQEIIDYITKKGLSINKKEVADYKIRNPALKEKIITIIENYKKYDLSNSLKKKLRIFGEKAVRLLKEKSVMFSFFDKDALDKKYWQEILDIAIKKLEKESSLQIDVSTSIDIYKVVRLPNTIHGGSFFSAKTIDYNALKNFKPFIDAYPFNKERFYNVYIKEMPRISFNNRYYGPFYDEIIELDAIMATYLCAKGVCNGIVLRDN